jgi:chaperonin GroEL (HSP60 family)
MAQLSGTPVLILKEGTERTRGKDATRQNITAARVIGETIRSALGPRGMDKMLVDNFDDVVITNDEQQFSRKLMFNILSLNSLWNFPKLRMTL